MDSDSSPRFEPTQQPITSPEPRAVFPPNHQTYTTTNPDTITAQNPTTQSVPATKQSLQELITPLADLEKEAIEQAILLCEGNIPAAAHYLGISAATVYRKRNTWKTN